MTRAVVARRGRQDRGGRRLRVAIGASVALFLVGAAGGTGAYVAGSAPARHNRALLLAYESRIEQSAKFGGWLVQQEIKPTIGDIQSRSEKYSREQFLTFTQTWERDMTRTRGEFFAAAPPAFLGDINERWARAFDGYLEAVLLIRAAVMADGPERDRLLGEGTDAGNRADKLFDRAAGVIKRWHRLLRMLPSSAFDPQEEG